MEMSALASVFSLSEESHLAVIIFDIDELRLSVILPFRNMKKLLFLAAISAVVMTFISCSTTSSTKSAPAQDRFAQADTNHDGKLSPQEAADYFVAQIFDSRDLNRDGKLTWDEWNVPGSDRSKAKFDAADTDHDGSLTLEEAKVYARKHGLFKKEFDEADTNHDGYVTKAEAQAYYASKEGPPR